MSNQPSQPAGSPGTATLSDEELVSLTREGDREAFGELYRRHATVAYNLALRMSGDGWVAADLVQDSFIKAFRALDSFAGRARFSTWLHRIIVNAAHDYHRQRRELAAGEDVTREIALDADSDGRPGRKPQAAERPAAAAGQNPATDGLSEPVHEALLALEPGFRAAVLLCDLLGYGYAEAAEILDVQEGTVKSRLFRARTALAENLRQAGYSDADRLTERPGNHSGAPAVSRKADQDPGPVTNSKTKPKG